MTIIQKPDLFCFSSALADIVIESNVSVTVVFSDGTDDFLREVYAPDSENRIYVRSLDELLVPYIPAITLRQHFLITVTPEGGSGDGAVEIETTVQFCSTGINLTAENFLENYFMTTLRNEKITCPAQKEYLSLVVSEATEVKITARYNTGAQTSKTVQITEANAGRVVTVDVSPSLFGNPETLFFIVVTAGARAFTYYMRRPSARQEQFIFINTFGVKETFIPAGLVLRENNYKNLFGYFSGIYRKYSVELVKQYMANTGVMNENMADWIESMFLSKEVFTISPAGIAEGVTIEESTVKRSSARDELPAYEFKYRLSRRNHDEFYVLKSRIFDDTFDYTFN
jgi:hypothetical protein